MLLHARTLFFCLAVLIFSLTGVDAQNADPKPEVNTPKASYEVTLQLLLSTESAADKLPSSLASIEKKLKNDFGQANYQVAMTLLNRISERGILETKGVSPFVQNQTGDKSFNFYKFNLYGIKPSENEISFDIMNFGLRIPLLIPTASDGKFVSVVQYEELGVNAKPINLPFNEPVIAGTLTTSRPNELIVLVLTVKPEAAPNRSLAKGAVKN